MRSNLLSYAFNRGVISPLGLARIDLKRLALSAAMQTNWICRTLGSMMLRPGLGYIDGIYNNQQAVHIPFIFSVSDTAIIELTDSLMRVRVNEQVISRPSVGSAITNGSFTTDLSGWTQNDDAGGLSQWATGSYMSLSGNGTGRGIRYQSVTVASGDQGVEHGLHIVVSKGYVNLSVGTTAGDDSYIAQTTLAPGVHSLALTPTGDFVVQLASSTEYATLVKSVAIEAAGVMTIATPWVAGNLSRVRWDQSADVVFVAAKGIAQQRIERRSTRSWSLVIYSADDGPFLNQNLDTSILLSASALNGDITLSSNRPFFKSSHVGALFRLQSQNGASVNKVVAGAQQWSDSIQVTGVSANGGRNLTINSTGTWVGTLALQYSVGAPGAWVDSGQNYTTNQTNTIYSDGFDNQDIFYRIGFENAYTSGSANVTLSFSQASTTAGIVRVDSVNSSTSVNAHVLKPLSGLTTLAGVAASGSITFAANPSNNDTIQLNGVTWTFKTSGATGAQTNIGVSLSATMIQLASDLNASSNASLTVATYSHTATAVGITYDTVGTTGNSYTLRSGNFNGTPSGPTLAGGVGATTGVGTTLWAQGLWSAYSGYPTAVAFYEGRLWWFGNDYVAGSVSDAYASYDQTVIGDSGPIIRTIGQGPVSTINWGLGLQRLILGCDGSEVSVRSDSLDTPLSPTNFNAKSPSTRGSAAVAAVKVDTNGLYVQRGDPSTNNNSGTRLIQIAYQGTYAIIDYTTSDLSEYCPELLAVGINKIAVQRKIDTRVHCVLNDGTVAVCIYDPIENEKAFVLISSPNGSVEDAFVMPGGVEDKVYYSVKRTINGNTVRYLERWAMESEAIGGTINKCSDSHVVITNGSPSTAISVPSLALQTVTVWADGKDVGTQADGTQLYTLDASGNATLATAATNVVVGIGYTAQFESVKLVKTLQGDTTLGQVQKITRLGVVLDNTHYQGLQYGTDFTMMEPLPLVEDGQVTAADTIWSAYDKESFEFPGRWTVDDRLCLQAASPRPCTILAANIGLEFNVR